MDKIRGAMMGKKLDEKGRALLEMIRANSLVDKSKAIEGTVFAVLSGKTVQDPQNLYRLVMESKTGHRILEKVWARALLESVYNKPEDGSFHWDSCVAGSNFAGAPLNELDITRLNLSGVNFTGANFSGAQIVMGEFNKANLDDTLCRRTIIIGTSLRKASLNRSRFSFAQLYGARMPEASFNYASFANTHLTKCIADKSQFEGTEFFECEFERSTMVGAELHGVSFKGCTFKRTFLSRSTLYDVDFGDSIVADGMSLEGSFLCKVDLSEVRGIHRVNLRDVHCDQHTKFPQGFDPKAAGVVLEHL